MTGPRHGACSELSGKGRATAGAVYVEFLIAFLPIFFFFLALVQLIFVQTANLITKHAAVKAVRAAVVVLHDDPKYYDGAPVGSFTGKRKDDIERAARIPLSTMGLDLGAVNVTLEGDTGRDALVRLRLEYDYHCKVPWGRFVVCGVTNTKKLTGVAAMPNQGVSYEY